MVKVLLFGQLADLVGKGVIEIALPADSSTPESLISLLPASVINELSDRSTMVSVNQVFADWDTQLSDGDEVAFMPPVSGG